MILVAVEIVRLRSFARTWGCPSKKRYRSARFDGGRLDRCWNAKMGCEVRIQQEGFRKNVSAFLGFVLTRLASGFRSIYVEFFMYDAGAHERQTDRYTWLYEGTRI